MYLYYYYIFFILMPFTYQNMISLSGFFGGAFIRGVWMGMCNFPYDDNFVQAQYNVSRKLQTSYQNKAITRDGLGKIDYFHLKRRLINREVYLVGCLLDINTGGATEIGRGMICTH